MPVVDAKQHKLAAIDGLLFKLTLALIFFGLIFVISASWYESLCYYGSPWIFIIKHILTMVIGFSAMYTMSIIHIQWLRKYAWIITLIVCLGLLITAKFGVVSGGARRWLDLGVINLQVSEFAKLAAALLTAKVVADKNKTWVAALLILFMAFLVLKQPDLGSSILILGASVAAIFASGFNLIIFVALISLLGALGYYQIISTPYQMTRIKYWLDPYSDPLGHGYNLIQSIKAIANGGLWGQGIGGSMQKLGPLPISYADFIFSVICEEIGFLGAVVLLLLFFAWILRAFSICFENQDKFVQVFGFAITTVLALQVLINVGVATGLFPITGMTLPLVSFGGSSFISASIAVGIVMNISRLNQNSN